MNAWFVDTSGFYAFLCADDPSHDEAVALFQRADAEGRPLVTTAYVVQECAALVQNRLGWEACDFWLDRVMPSCEVADVDGRLRALGLARWRQARARSLSLTDCVSFEWMRQRGIAEAIAFDAHYGAQGFTAPPA